MKFQPDSLDGTNVITRLEGQRLWLGHTVFDHALVVPWTGPVRPWTASRFDDLLPADFESLLALRPEVVIFGSGSRLRFASPALTRALIEQGIGVETMDTAAACRTYNVLASEGRSVVAALLLEASVLNTPSGTGPAKTI
jgi:uncharacterized protein